MFRAAQRLGRRNFHQVADLGLTKGAGLPGLFSPKGLDIAWFEYQHYLITEINKQVEATPELATFSTISALAEACTQSPDVELRRIAALASQAYTNEFFFRSLKKDGSVNPEAIAAVNEGKVYNKDASVTVDVSKQVLNMPKHPETTASESQYASGTQEPVYPSYNYLSDPRVFGDIATFRELLITRGDAQFGNGAVWLVKTNSKVALMNTYGWGTPLSHTNEGANEHESLTSTSSQLTVSPVLGINLWEHVYLHDYGVAGKREFLTNVFDCIDWGVIDDRLSPTVG